MYNRREKFVMWVARVLGVKSIGIPKLFQSDVSRYDRPLSRSMRALLYKEFGFSPPKEELPFKRRRQTAKCGPVWRTVKPSSNAE